MRTYLILKDRAARWNADPDIQALVRPKESSGLPNVSGYSAQSRDSLLALPFDRVALASTGLAYERLDQLTTKCSRECGDHDTHRNGTRWRRLRGPHHIDAVRRLGYVDVVAVAGQLSRTRVDRRRRPLGFAKVTAPIKLSSTTPKSRSYTSRPQTISTIRSPPRFSRVASTSFPTSLWP